MYMGADDLEWQTARSGQRLLCSGDACIPCMLYGAMLCTSVICLGRCEATSKCLSSIWVLFLQLKSCMFCDTLRVYVAKGFNETRAAVYRPDEVENPRGALCVFDRYPQSSCHRAQVRYDCRRLLQQASTGAGAAGLLDGD